MNKAISMSLLAVVLLWAVPARADFNENGSAYDDLKNASGAGHAGIAKQTVSPPAFAAPHESRWEWFFGRTQYRPAMLAYFNWLVGKVRENGELSAGTWSIQNNVSLKGSGDDIMLENLLLAGSHVDEDPSTPDVLSVREELHNSDFDSIESATITRKEETGILGLGRREVIVKETDTWILYRGPIIDFRREYRTRKRVKIDANSGKELEDKSQSVP